MMDAEIRAGVAAAAGMAVIVSMMPHWARWIFVASMIATSVWVKLP